MTSKIIVNNIGSDSGINTVTFDSNVVRGDSNLHSTGLALGAGSTVGAVTGVTSYYGDGSNLTNISGPNITGVIPSSSLSNVDLTGIRRDIALLSLQTAVDTNRVVYNLENSFIDQFENSTGLSTTTNVSRDRLDEFLFAGTQTAQSAVSYPYDGSDDYYTPGANIKFFLAYIWGAAGGSGYNYSSGGGGSRASYTGGPGGFTTGTVTVRADTNTQAPTYVISPGQGGQGNDVTNSYTNGADNGGGRGRVNSHAGAGGGGGGYSGIFLQSKTHANSVLIAGGGGGSIGGGVGEITDYWGGAGGGLTGQDGGQSSHSSHANVSRGLGGTQTSGGAIWNWRLQPRECRICFTRW